MTGDLFAFSRARNTASLEDPHRDSAREIQTLCVRVTGPVVGQRVVPYESLLRSRALSRLAAAEARIAELESALRVADKRAERLRSIAFHRS